MKKWIAKHFDGATWWQALLGCAMIAAPYVILISKL